MMWTIGEYKRAFYLVGLVGIIMCFVPSLMELAGSPPNERFSELYILADHTGNYPFNVSTRDSYNVSLGVGNHVGSSVYYDVAVKFRNSSEALPNGTEPSPLPMLYEYRVFLEDGKDWDGNLTFSFSQVSFPNNVSCNVGKIMINNAAFEIDKTATWDTAKDTAKDTANSGFYYQLLVELWSFNQTADRIQYDGRFVSLWLNMTSNA
jgi:hypothetical protein